jgi:hypothetical protein|tara:strand:- start:168 stop:617 length:450 start_codon:yes stop_codon:yes gene_type:complete
VKTNQLDHLTIDDSNWIPVHFVMLTEQNNTSKWVLFRNVERFLKSLMNFTDCHLKAIRGYELGNTHEHLIVFVKPDEESRYWEKVKDFKPALAWTHRKLGFKKFKEEMWGEALSYTLVKHTPVLQDESKEYFCPRVYTRCKKGRCLHTK